MNVIEMFRVLGIEPTKDEKSIKQAYREKLTVTNPEDNPEGFKRLRAAYEEACAYASRQEAPEEEAEKEDDTPSGRWVKKADEIYRNIRSRQDTELWKELFREDIFLSLEGEEECRLKLLRYFMEHYRLPTDVWELLDEKLSIKNDFAGLKEHFPADFVRYIVNKCERGEDVEFNQFEGPEDAPYDLFLQCYDRCWRALQDGDLALAEQSIAEADGCGIVHPIMEINRANLLLKQEKTSDTYALIERLLERYPGDLTVNYNSAEIYWQQGEKERASEIYQKLKEENDDHYMANLRLTEWYYESGDARMAKKCAERVLSAGADDTFMELLRKVNVSIERELEQALLAEEDVLKSLELGWCYLQDGKYSKGIRLAESLEGRVPDDKREEHTGLLTKLYVEETMYEDAVSMARLWEKQLNEKLEGGETEEEKRKDMDRIRQSHVIRMQSYHQMGFADKELFKEAIKEAELLEERTARDIGILLEKAQIYMEMGEYDKSLGITDLLIGDFQIYAAHATALEVHRRQWNAGGVIQESGACISYFPNYVKAYEHAAKVYLDLNRKEDLEKLLKDAEDNGVKSVILDAYRYQSTHEVPGLDELDKKIQSFRSRFRDPLEEGKLSFYEEGLPVLTEYLYCYPGCYMLVERGLFHQAANRFEEARADFEKALAENPVQPYALNGLSFTYRYLGDFEKALVYVKRAIRYMDDDMGGGIYGTLAEIYSLLGDDIQAAAAYARYTELCGKKSRNRMFEYAVCLQKCGKTDEALSLLEETLVNCQDELFAWKTQLLQAAGRREEAEKALKEWQSFIKKNKWEKEQEWNLRSNYYEHALWNRLLFGDRQQIIKNVRRISMLPRVKNDSWMGSLLVFTCALYGEDKLGKSLAGRLRKALRNDSLQSVDVYLYRRKMELFRNMLCAYYLDTAPEQEKLLEQGGELPVCHSCTDCTCIELNAARWLLLWNLNRKEEARAELSRNRSLSPTDVWSRAILRYLEGAGQPL